MKKITLLALLVVTMMQSLSAQDSSFHKHAYSGRRVKDHDYFVAKAQKDKTAAWLMLSAGAALVIGGEIAYNNNSSSNGFEDLTNDFGADIAIAAGVLVASGSVPLFLAARHFNKRARQTSLSFDLQRGPLEMRPSMASGYFPAMSLKFRF